MPSGKDAELAKKLSRLAADSRQRMKALGIKRYRWRTVMDQRVRPGHARLEGKVFTWGNPPVTDQETGARHHPGEEYLCRCYPEPILKDIASGRRRSNVPWRWLALAVLLAVTLYFLFVRGSAGQDDSFEHAAEAYTQKDFQTVVGVILPLAEAGSVRAQKWMAQLYMEVSGVEDDSHESTRWLKLAADAGDAEAQFDLGGRFEHGIGVPRDKEFALKYFCAAYRNKHPYAQVLYRDLCISRTRPPISRSRTPVVGKSMWWPPGQLIALSAP